MNDELIDRCIVIASRAAGEYLRVHKLQADPGALAACLRSWLKIKLPEALAAAKQALDCQMHQAAEMTFALTIAEAGIEAAKEAGLPAGVEVAA